MKNVFLILPICFALSFYFQYFNYEYLLFFDLSEWYVFLRICFALFANVYPANYFLAKFKNVTQMFLYMFINKFYYYYFYSKVALVQI